MAREYVVTGRVQEMRPRLATLSTEEAHETICDAYTYGYPLVLMDVTRQLMTDVTTAGDQRAPLNRFAHAMRPFRSLAFPDPNLLQSTAWLSLTREPVVLSLPDMNGRHYSMQLIDAWINVFASLGSRISRDRRRHIAIVGPQWSGAIPDGMHAIEAPTNMVWLIGQIETSGDQDFAAVHALQQQFHLTPLGVWRSDYRPPQRTATPRGMDRRVSAAERVSKMDASEFFGRLNTLMTDNPPGHWDGSALKRFREIGIGPGLPFDVRDDATVARSVDGSARTALARIVVETKKPTGVSINGWWMPRPAGEYDADYMRRAVMALLDPGANRPEDGVWLRADADADGRPLSGAERYTIRITGHRDSPFDGPWSIAMYNARQTVVQNPIDRHGIGHRNALTITNDRSITLYIQHKSPGPGRESNWLPAPVDQFVLMMRFYRPGPEILDNSWTPPSIERK